MHSLMRAVPTGRTDFGRDVDQLPSVWAGHSASGLDREWSGASCVSPKCFRQAPGSQIITTAPHPPSQMPDVRGADPTSDFHSSRGIPREDRGNAGQAGAGEDSKSDFVRPDPRRAGSLPDEPGVRSASGTEQRTSASVEPYAIRPVLCGAVRVAVPDGRQGNQTENDYDKRSSRGHRNRLTGSSGRALSTIRFDERW